MVLVVREFVKTRDPLIRDQLNTYRRLRDRCHIKF